MTQFTMKSALFAAAIMFVFTSCGGNKEKYSLEYNVNQGDVFEQVITMDMKINQNMMGQSIDIGTTIQMDVSYNINDVQEEAIGLDYVIESLNMDMNMGPTSFSLSSDTEEKFATLTDMNPILKSITKLPFNMIMDKKGSVQSISGFEKMMESMLNAFDDTLDEATKQQLLAQFEQQFSSESMQSTFDQSIAQFPAQPVKIGESWNTTAKINSGQVKMDMETKTTLKSVNGNIAVLESKGDFLTDTPIVQTVNGMETKISIKGTQKGTSEIDLETGWLLKSEIVQDMKCEVEAQGMKIPQNISSKTTISGK